jgi:hypothetical protein
VAASYQPVTISTCFAAARNLVYNVEGAFIYSNTQDTVGVEIEDTTGFWRNDPKNNNPNDTLDGRLNRVGIWLCNHWEGSPNNIWEGLTVPLSIPPTGTLLYRYGF